MITIAVAAMLVAAPLDTGKTRAPLRQPDRFEQSLAQTDTPQAPHAVELSDAYYTRLTVHKYASFAMLPLFAAEYYVGNKLYNGTASETERSLHGPLAVGIIGLFGVNTVTGVWNLVEARHSPEGRTKRTIHSLLMLAADAGFAATAATAPDDGEGGFGRFEGGEGGNRSTHKAIAITSMGMAAASWIMMLIPTGD